MLAVSGSAIDLLRVFVAHEEACREKEQQELVRQYVQSSFKAHKSHIHTNIQNAQNTTQHLQLGAEGLGKQMEQLTLRTKSPAPAQLPQPRTTISPTK